MAATAASIAAIQSARFSPTSSSSLSLSFDSSLPVSRAGTNLSTLSMNTAGARVVETKEIVTTTITYAAGNSTKSSKSCDASSTAASDERNEVTSTSCEWSDEEDAVEDENGQEEEKKERQAAAVTTATTTARPRFIRRVSSHSSNIQRGSAAASLMRRTSLRRRFAHNQQHLLNSQLQPTAPSDSFVQSPLPPPRQCKPMRTRSLFTNSETTAAAAAATMGIAEHAPTLPRQPVPAVAPILRKQHAHQSGTTAILRSLSFQFTPLRKRLSKTENPYDLSADDGPTANNGDKSALSSKSTTMDTKKSTSSLIENCQTTNSMPSLDVGCEPFGPVLGVQAYGVLGKKYRRRGRTAKWTKRFFALKECFLLYYASRVEKKFEKSRRLDLHPKGIVPLMGCSVVAGGESGRRHCLLIAHPQFKAPFILAAPDAQAQERWLAKLRAATKISLSNTAIGDSLIRQLETRATQLDDARRQAEDKFGLEQKAREGDRQRAIEAEAARSALDSERDRLLRTTKKLSADLMNCKNELKLTNEQRSTLESEKQNLMAKTEHLSASMQALTLEREKLDAQMVELVRDRERVLIDNQNLSAASCDARNRLRELESRVSCLATEKQQLEQMLAHGEQKLDDLERERAYYAHQVKELQNALKTSNAEKDMTESELKDEMLARIGAEKQLQAAERALEHLEMALRVTGAQMSELKEHIMPDVHALREFFERCAERSKLDAQRTGIMRSALLARRSIRRSKRGSTKGGLKRATSDRVSSGFSRWNSKHSSGTFANNNNHLHSTEISIDQTFVKTAAEGAALLHL